MTVILIDGKLVESTQATISCEDPAFLFGHGVFSTCLVRDGRIPFFQNHLDRLRRQSLQLALPIDPFDVTLLPQLLRSNDALEGSWRLKLIQTPHHQQMMITRALPPPKIVNLVLYPDPIVRPLAKLKSLAYYDRFLVKQYALTKGAEDSLVLDAKGNILETAFSNILWLKNKTLHFVDPSLPYLEGITQQALLNAAEKMGYEISPSSSSIGELQGATAFTTNAIQGVVPVCSFDGVSLETGAEFEGVLKREFERMEEESAWDVCGMSK